MKTTGPVDARRGGSAGRASSASSSAASASIALEQLGVALGRLLRRGPEVVQEAHRVLAGELPAVRVDVAEDGGAVARPAPAVVVGDPRERLQARREAVGEDGGARLEVGGAGDEDAAQASPSSITKARLPASWSPRGGPTRVPLDRRRDAAQLRALVQHQPDTRCELAPRPGGFPASADFSPGRAR